MANTRSYSLGPGLSTAEQIAGFCYLPFFAGLLAWGLERLTALLGLSLTELQLNVCYFVLNCVFVWIIFHNVLLRSFRGIRFWELVQALILGLALYYAGNFLFARIVQWLGLEITSFNDQTVAQLTGQNQTVMILCGVLLVPMVEETLTRGLIFGVLRRKSRLLAYIVSILFFAAVHVWQYALIHGLGPVALAALQYIPAGIALGWTYEKANTIWAPIALHMVINAIAFGVMTLF